MISERDPAPLTVKVIHGPVNGEALRRWRTFLQAAPWASHFVSPEYFLDPTIRGRRPFALLAEQPDAILGCLTGCHLGSETVSGMLTHPQLAILDVPSRPKIEVALARALLREAHRSSFVSLFSWTELTSLKELGFRGRRCSETFVIDLTVPEDALFRQLNAKRRNNIKAAVKRGVAIREAHPEDIDAFCRLLTATHQRHGLTVAVSRSDLLIPNTNRTLFVADHSGRCVAGTILRYHAGGLAEYSENASLPEHWSLRPNDLLLWHSITWAKSIGCRWFNFGGHDLFKKEFGGVLLPIYRLTFDNSWFRRRERREWLEAQARRLYRAVRKLRRWPLRGGRST